jgi:hypothetical protein
MAEARHSRSGSWLRNGIALAIGVPTAWWVGGRANELGYAAAPTVVIACLAVPAVPCLVSRHAVVVGLLVGALLGVSGGRALDGTTWVSLTTACLCAGASLVVSLPLEVFRATLLPGLLRWASARRSGGTW